MISVRMFTFGSSLVRGIAAVHSTSQITTQNSVIFLNPVSVKIFCTILKYGPIIVLAQNPNTNLSVIQ